MTDLDDVLNQLSDICKPIVEAIESKPPTCKDHYDAYMVAIDKISAMLPPSENNRQVKLGVGIALQRAGGNKQGVTSALRTMGVI